MSGKSDPREIARRQRRQDELTEQRRAAQRHLEEVSEAAEQGVVWLLKAGVPRSSLVDRPFSSGALTAIQHRHGLVKRRGEIA